MLAIPTGAFAVRDKTDWIRHVREEGTLACIAHDWANRPPAYRAASFSVKVNIASSFDYGGIYEGERLIESKTDYDRALYDLGEIYDRAHIIDRRTGVELRGYKNQPESLANLVGANFLYVMYRMTRPESRYIIQPDPIVWRVYGPGLPAPAESE